MSRRIIALVAAGATVLAVAPADAGKKRKRAPNRTVKVHDNYFLPAKLTVRVGTRITWRWPDDAGDVHDVKLVKAPKGVRRFQSEAAASAYAFRRTLRKPGTYRFLCTFHEEDEMILSVRVRRR